MSLRLSHLQSSHLLTVSLFCLHCEGWKLGRLGWLRSSSSSFEDDEDDEVNMQQALDQLQASIDEDPLPCRRAGGSQQGMVPNINRDRGEMDQRMFKDYFSTTPTFGPVHFYRQYCMRRSLFLTIMERVCTRDSYFLQKPDAIVVLGLFLRQKLTATLCMLALGVCANAMDKYYKISESTAMECMKRFCIVIRAEFSKYHLRQPTRADFEKQFAINMACGFLGMFSSLDCMHYEWKNCPIAWQGDFGDRDGKKSIILEAVADESLYIWHIFFWVAWFQ
jgi:hypothetical protein